MLVSTLNKLTIIIIIIIIIIAIIIILIRKIIIITIIIIIIFQADVGADYMIPVGWDEILSLIPAKRDEADVFIECNYFVNIFKSLEIYGV